MGRRSGKEEAIISPIIVIDDGDGDSVDNDDDQICIFTAGSLSPESELVKRESKSNGENDIMKRKR